MDETLEHIKTMNEARGERDTKALEQRVQRLEELMLDTIGILKSNWTLPASMYEFVEREK